MQQFIAIRRAQNRPQGVVGPVPADAGGHRQQVKVVIAQHGDGTGSQLFYQAQGFEGAAAAIDHIPGQPQAVAARLEAKRLEHFLQGHDAALNISDRINRHRPAISGLAELRR